MTRLFIEFPKKDKFRTCCVQKLFFCFCIDIQNNICTQHVLNLYFSGNSMNNLSSYYGLSDSRMRADLPVKIAKLCTALCSIIRRGHERENASLRHPALCSGLVRLPTDLFSCISALESTFQAAVQSLQ